jgi:chromosome segregation ATPase
MKKQIQAEQGKADLEQQIESQENRKKELEDRVVELKLKIEAIENRTKQHREVLRK